MNRLDLEFLAAASELYRYPLEKTVMAGTWALKTK
jgi:hypothetical protein